mgnify:CR=1 FL=1
MATNTKKSALILRLKSLFVGKKQETQNHDAEAAIVHFHSKEAFRAGAAVTFITPIGAYAGSVQKDAARTKAMEQFHQMNTTTHTTIN